jgi:hypothetical protein
MDDFPPAYPKPKKREKKPRKGVNRVRPEGKRSYSADQRARRRAEDTLYRKHTRPGYLLDLARAQGRLRRADLPGETNQHRLQSLTPDELPLCEVGVAEGCDGRLAAVHVHHVKGRGPHLNDPSTYKGVCPRCHDHIENNRKWAREHGLLSTRHAHVQESGREES